MTADQPKPTTLPHPIEMGKSGLVLRTSDDLFRLAKAIVASKMAPKSLDTQEKVAIAIITGAEAGLSPMMSMRSVYVVNGAPAWTTKAARALIRNSGLLKPGTRIEEGVRHSAKCESVLDGDKQCDNECAGYCRTWRMGDAAAREHTFSVADAKRAGLWMKKSKDGYPSPWCTYPHRMLMHRAAGFHFDDVWADILMGLTTQEVLEDLPAAAFIRDGDSVTANLEPPRMDPLLARAIPAVVELGEKDEGPVASDPVGDPLDSDTPSREEAAGPSTPEEMGVELATEVEQPPKKKRGEDPRIVKCETCPRKIDRETEAHWSYDGKYRCAECGPREKETRR